MNSSKTAFITGANRGIGLEIARQLGKQGFFIWLSARNPEKGQKAMEWLRKEGIQGDFLAMDVSQWDSIQEAYQELDRRNAQIDVLINNAGVLLDHGANILRLSPGIAEQTLYTNALGPMWITQNFLPLMPKGGRVIMISSEAGAVNKEVSTWAPLYSISKTTLNAITRQLDLALESRGIIINTMCPGWVRSEMGGDSAPRSVEKGAETAVWLATEAPLSLHGKFIRDKKEIPW